MLRHVLLLKHFLASADAHTNAASLQVSYLFDFDHVKPAWLIMTVSKATLVGAHNKKGEMMWFRGTLCTTSFGVVADRRAVFLRRMCMLWRTACRILAGWRRPSRLCRIECLLSVALVQVSTLLESS